MPSGGDPSSAYLFVRARTPDLWTDLTTLRISGLSSFPGAVVEVAGAVDAPGS